MQKLAIIFTLAFVGQAVSENLPELVEIALEQNPKIEASRLRWRSEVEKLPQATALPNPMLMYGFYARPVETRVGPQRHRIGLSQTFPYPGTLKIAGKVSKLSASIAEEKYKQTIRNLITDLKIAYHELTYLDRAIELTTKNRELLSQILQRSSASYAQNSSTLYELMSAQTQLAQLSNDLILLQEMRQVEVAKLNAILNRPSTEPIISAVPTSIVKMEMSLSELENRAIVERPEIRLAELKIERSAEVIKLEKFKTKANFKLELMTVETGKSSMPDVSESGKNPWIVGFGMSLPVWRSKNESRGKVAKLRHEAEVALKKSVENWTREELRKIYFRLENSRRLIELYEETLIPQANKTVEMAESLQSEKSVIGQLETRSVWLNFNLARERAVADYLQNLAKIERLIGEL